MYASKDTGTLLFAPTVLPAVPGGYTLASSVEVSADSYQVYLGFTRRPLAINSPSLNTSQANQYATFGARTYNSASAAGRALAAHRTSEGACLNCHITAHTAVLALGVRATDYEETGPTGQAFGSEYIWSEQSWAISVDALNAAQALQLAHLVTSYLAVHKLPSREGIIFVGIGFDAGTSSADWQVGRSVITVSANAGSVNRLLAIARAMAPNPVTPQR